MIRTTISIPDEEFQGLKRLAARTDRSVSWLLRQAFRLAKPRLESGASYAETFDRVWAEIGGSLRGAGIDQKQVGQLIARVRSRKPRTKTRTGKRWATVSAFLDFLPQSDHDLPAGFVVCEWRGEVVGTFAVEVVLAHPGHPERVEPVKLLVDTGSAYTWLSASLLRDLGLGPSTSRRILTIQGHVIERPAAEVLLTLDGQTLHTLCLFGEPGELEVLGAVTLEQFGLAVDPVARRLIPALPYGA